MCSGNGLSLDGLIAIIDTHCFRVVKGNDTVVQSEVCFSIMILWTSLVLCKKRWFPDSAHPREPLLGTADEMLRERLASKGWCKSDI